MENLTITKENAIKAYDAAGKKTQEVLANLLGRAVFLKDVKDRIKTFEDALQTVGDTLENFNKRTALDSADEKAYKQVKVIVAALNEGWKPNWDDSNEYKYYPWFKLSSSGVGFSSYGFIFGSSYSVVGSRLVFKSRELAEYAGKQFLAEYRGFMVIE